MNNYIQLGELIKTISKTHKFDKKELVFLNTSDVLEGKILTDHYTAVSALKGQAKKSIKNGDILYSEIRPKNKRYAYVKNLQNPEDYVVSTKLMVLRNNSKDLDTDYLYHFLTYEETLNHLQRRAENRIGSFPQITFEVLKTLQIWLPSLPKQKRIAKVLSDIDAKIEVNNKINQELEAMAKTLYDYWFVQFDFPTSARYAASVGKPELKGKPYKSSGGKMVFNEELKREIPEGWEVKKLNEIAKTGSGGTPLKSKKEYYKNGTIPWINSGEVNAPFIVSASKFINEVGLKESSAKLFGRGTILMAMYGATAGKVSLIDLEACTNQAICAIIPDREFLNYYIKFSLEDLYKYLVNLSSGSARDNLSQDKIKQLNLVLPNKTLLQKFHQNISPMMNKILVNMKENQKLTELRDWLLPMLMNGQVNVGRSVAERDFGKKYAEGELGTDDYRKVAEEEIKYGKEEKLKDLFPTLNYDFELAAVVLLTEQRFKLNYGKKYLHKIFSNMQFLASLPKINELQFSEKGWGMFSKGLAQSVKNEVHIKKSKLDNGRTIYKVKSGSYKEVINWMNDPQNNPFIDEVASMLTIYEKPLIDCGMDRIELLNTVLQCTKALDTYDFPKIYDKMKTWKMEEPGFEFKADKFEPEETRYMIRFIKDEI
ncbi:MAG TPA: restriction endonuclease subunit S [Salinimicrobium sp.]|nr:restriction endonuclease subunit S [Salinimicrobium sp.]